MEVRRYLSVVRRRLVLVLLIIAAALTAGWLITPRESEYTATSTLYVGSRSIDIDPRSGEVSGDRVVGLDRLMTTFSGMLESRRIADAAIERSDVDRSPKRVIAETDATQITGTNLMAISVSDRDPVVAQVLANGLAEAFELEIQDFEPGDTESGTEVVSVYERARLPTTPDSSNLIRNLLLAGLVGIVIAGGAVALLEHLDISVRSADDIERRLELPVLGIVPALGDHIPVTPAARVSRLPTPTRPAPPPTTPAPRAGGSTSLG